jgi:hypothetical protein
MGYKRVVTCEGRRKLPNRGKVIVRLKTELHGWSVDAERIKECLVRLNVGHQQL